MRAAAMHRARNVRIEDIPDPSMVEPSDAIPSCRPRLRLWHDLWPYNSMEASETGRSMGTRRSTSWRAPARDRDQLQQLQEDSSWSTSISAAQV